MPRLARTLKLSPDEKFLYVIGIDAVAVFEVMSVGDVPDLRFVQRIDNAAVQSMPEVQSGRLRLTFEEPTDLVFNTQADRVYVTDAGTEDGIAIFERNVQTGTLDNVKQKLRKENSFGKSVEVGNEPIVQEGSS